MELLTLGGIGGTILLMTSGFYYALCGVVAAGVYFLRNWSQGKRCDIVQRLDGKIVVITGGNTGIGKETARALSRLGAKVIIGSRNVEKSKKAAQEIQDATGREVIALALDLASFESVQKFAKEVLSISGNAIHILINNAGIMFIPEELTKDGNEKTIQVNHLGHFLLTKLLMPKLLEAKPARIINVSSLAHTWAKSLDVSDLNLKNEGYGQIKSYAKSKLANILFTKELDRRYKDLHVYSYAVHPGTVSTELSAHVEARFPEWFNKTIGEVFKAIFLKTSENGAQTSIYCAIQPDPRLLSGSYFSDCSVKQPSKAALDEATQECLWIKSEEIVGPFLISAPNELPEKLVETPDVLENKGVPDSSSSESDDEPEIIEEIIKETKTVETDLPPPSKSEIVEEVIEETLEKIVPSIASEVQVTEDVKEPETTKDSSSSSSSSESESEEEEIKEPKEENLMENIESFEKSNLKAVETVVKSSIPDHEIVAQEKEIIHAETEQNKEVFGQVTDEILSHNIETLLPTEVKESNTLPDKYDLLKEKVEENLVQDVHSFDTSTLKNVTTYESSSVEILKRQDSLKKNIAEFDVEQLKPAEVLEKVTLPTKEEIEFEKSIIEEETAANKQTFTKEVVEKLEAFDSNILKHVEKDSSSDEDDALKEAYIKEKTHQKLLAEVSSFEETNLSHVKTLEPMTGGEFAKTELQRSNTLEEVTSFDKATLKTTITEEKVILPDTNTLSMEKQNEGRDKILSEISSFEASTLKATEIEEKNLLPTGDDINQERVHRELLTNIGEFDSAKLSKISTEEKSNLPDLEDIQQEKAHQQLLESVETFPVDSLKHVEEIKESKEPLIVERERSNSGSSSSSSSDSGSSSQQASSGGSSWEKVDNNDA